MSIIQARFRIDLLPLSVAVLLTAALGLGLSASAGTFVDPLVRSFFVGDFDGDGKDDILFVKTSGDNQGLLRISLQDGTAQTAMGFPFILDSTWSVVGVGHFDDDIQAEILVQKNAGETNAGLLKVIDLDATGLAMAASGQKFLPLLLDPALWSIEGIGYLNSDDSRADLVFEKISGPNTGLIRVLLTGTQGAIYTSGGQYFPGVAPSGYAAVGLADIDGDKNADFVFHKSGAPNAGLIRFQPNTSNGTAWGSAGFTMITGTVYDLVGIADYDATNGADFLLRMNGTGGNPGLYRIRFVNADADGTMGTTFPYLETESDFQTIGTGDYDGVTGPDITCRETTTGMIKTILLDGSGEQNGPVGYPVTLSEYTSQSLTVH